MNLVSPFNRSTVALGKVVAFFKLSKATLQARIRIYICCQLKVPLIQPGSAGFERDSVIVVILRPGCVKDASSVKEANICSSKPPLPKPP